MSLAYVLLTIFLPPDASTLLRYKLTVTQAHLIALSAILPYIAIWFIAMYGAQKFHEYAMQIHEKRDGKHLLVLAKGLRWRAASMPAIACLGTIVAYIRHYWPHYSSEATIINNYIALGVSVVTFTLIVGGTRGLISSIKRTPTLPKRIIAFGLFAGLSMLYVYLTLNNPARQFPPAGSNRAAYFLPDWLLVSTIMIPYIYVWHKAFESVVNLLTYKSQVRGILYRQALRLFILGNALVILASLMIQYLTSLVGVLNEVSLKGLLAIVYVFLLLIGIGYGYIATGAKRLKKLEDV